MGSRVTRDAEKAAGLESIVRLAPKTGGLGRPNDHSRVATRRQGPQTAGRGHDVFPDGRPDVYGRKRQRCRGHPRDRCPSRASRGDDGARLCADTQPAGRLYGRIRSGGPQLRHRACHLAHGLHAGRCHRRGQYPEGVGHRSVSGIRPGGRDATCDQVGVFRSSSTRHS
jgi:hypothetical protein